MNGSLENRRFYHFRWGVEEPWKRPKRWAEIENLSSRGGPAVAAALHAAEERHSAHNDLTACQMRYAYDLCLLRDLWPLRHSGHTRAPTPTAD